MLSGSSFGDYEVIFQTPRYSTMRSKTDSVLLTLSKEVILLIYILQAYSSIITSNYPDVAQEMADEATEKRERSKNCLNAVNYNQNQDRH